jgi:threonylcarbamoyladenosine tRNA methylthiotransferase MtaB
MIRRTSQAEFGALVAAARHYVPTMAITTDVIVGFPGETDEEYAVSRDFIESLAFAGMHIFRYSPRAGTAAVKLPDHVSESVKHRRSDDLHTLALKAEQTFAERYLGTDSPVLWEAISGSTERGFINNGYTDHFIRVQSIVPRVLTDTITAVTLIRWDAAARVMHATLAV